MPKVSCTACGATYNVNEAKMGKRAKCVKCGEHFMLPAHPVGAGRASVEHKSAPPQRPLIAELSPDTIPFGDLDGLAGGEAVVVAPAMPATIRTATSREGGVEFAVEYEYEVVDDEGDGSAPGKVLAGYLTSVGRSFRMFTRVGNVITFAIVCFIYGLKPIVAWGGGFGMAGLLIINGWYMAYLLNVVISGAKGEEDLPDMTLTEGFLDGVLVPMLKFLAVVIFAHLFFIGALVYLVFFNEFDGWTALAVGLTACSMEYEAVLESSPVALAALLPTLALALLVKPMMLLVVAIGGIPELLRVDLMVITIVKALPAYVVMVVLTLAANFAPVLILKAMESDGPPSIMTAVVLPMLVLWFAAFCSVLAMRWVGLFYHHFKHSFAWAWE